jgi:hypothetical protein
MELYLHFLIRILAWCLIVHKDKLIATKTKVQKKKYYSVLNILFKNIYSFEIYLQERNSSNLNWIRL